MPVGFESLTPGGALQINSEMRIYDLSFSGVVTGGSFRRISFSGGTFPMLVLPLEVALLGTDMSTPGVTHWDIRTGTTNPIPYAIFDVTPVSTPSAFGMQLFNAMGQLTFDALRRPLIAIHIQPNTDGFSLPVTPGITYGFTYGGAWYNSYLTGAQAQGEFEYNTEYMAGSIFGTPTPTLSVGAFFIDSNLTPQPASLDLGSPPITVMVIDMTGIF